MRPAGPVALDVSLHGMTAATGAWHLIDRDSIERTAELRARYAEAVGEGDELGAAEAVEVGERRHAPSPGAEAGEGPEVGKVRGDLEFGVGH